MAKLIRHRASMLRAIALPSAAALLIGVGFAGCGKKEATTTQKQTSAVPVTVGQVRLGQVQRTVEVVGTLHGEEDATLSNKVPGRLIAIYKDVGDRAEPGEPLGQLLKNDYLLSVQEKRSALLESLAKLGVSDVPGEDFDLSNLPAVRRAKLQADNAEAKFNRGRQLYEQKPPLVSQQDYEDLRTAFDVAKSEYDVQLATARGLIGEARTRLANMRVAEQALADTTIRAPRESYGGPNLDPTTRPGPAVLAAMGNGGDPDADVTPPAATQPAGTQPSNKKIGRFFIARRFATVGELFSAITPMFRLVDDDPLKLKAAVPERYYRSLSIGQEVTVRIDAYADAFTGIVQRISPQVDEANRTFPIEISIPNADHKLPPGAFGRASIKTEIEDGVVLVPTEAVVSFAGVDKVFVVKEGKAQEVQIQLGERLKNEFEVRSGLKGGETLITTGTSRLATGVPVEIKPSTRPATAPGMGPAEKTR